MNIMFGNESIESACTELKYSPLENMEHSINDFHVLNFFGLENLIELSNDYEIDKLYKLIEKPGLEDEDFPLNVYSPDYIAGVEGIIWDTFKTTGRAVRGTIKTVHKAHKMAYKHVNDMKLNWNQNIKPLIIKILKEFQTQLSIMWGKFRKYDELYTKLGKEISSVINVYGKQLEQLPNITIYYHKFNAKLLRGFAEVISSYDAFMGAIKGSPDLFNGNFVEPKAFAEIVRSNDVNKARSAVDSMSSGMQKLNQRGDLSIAFAMMNDAGKNTDSGTWSKIKNFFVSEDNDRILRIAIKNKTPLVQFVQIAILRNEVNKAYNSSNVSMFKADILDRNDSYLPVLASILNRKVIQTVLERGATSIKKETNDDLTNMESIVKQAQNDLDKAKREGKLNDQENDNRQRSDVTGNTGGNNGGNNGGGNNGNGNLESEVKNAENNTNNIKKEGPESAIPNLYEYLFGSGTEADDEFFKPINDTSAANNNNSSNTSNDNESNNTGSGGLGMPELVAAYCQTYSIFMSKCTSGYSSIVKAVLAATFTLCKEADTIVNTIYDAAGAKRDEATKGFTSDNNG